MAPQHSFEWLGGSYTLDKTFLQFDGVAPIKNNSVTGLALTLSILLAAVLTAHFVFMLRREKKITS